MSCSVESYAPDSRKTRKPSKVNPSMDSVQIEELAGHWLARRDRSGWSERDEAEFQAWLEQSTAHMVAFVRLEAAWKQAKRLKALSAGVPPGSVPSPEEWQLTAFFDKRDPDQVPASRVSEFSRLADQDSKVETSETPDAGTFKRSAGPNRVRAIAATFLLAAVSSVAWYIWPTGPDYSTPVGGLASVPMSDGSKVTLNTDSQIRVALTETERRVELQQGEAFFEVAKDPNRPFVVTVGKKRVIAVGTAFSVRRNGNDVRVAITEGRVRIEDAAERSTEQDVSDEKILTLSAGSIARATDAGVLIQERPILEIQTDLSWRTGYLIFRDMALADAVAEFNRYNTRKILIDDPTVAAIRVSGKFRSTQFEAFVRLLEEGFPVRAQNVDDRIVLTDSRSKTNGVTSEPD
jgi:transmembrane sensor